MSGAGPVIDMGVTMNTEMKLTDGVAEHMGNGVFVLCQRDENGVANSVVVTLSDLRRLQEAEG
jgi:hypothetical protein